MKMVSICCITYNQSKFIKQCLDGFLMQQCHFEYEILIHDDASTDGTMEIIQEYYENYPNLIKPIYQQDNKYSKGVRGINFIYNFPRAEGKYIALCEGDDYWTDPFKLEKQIKLLEHNNGYIISFHDNKIVNKKDVLISESKLGLENRRSLTSHEVINGSLIPSNSVVFRNNKIVKQILKNAMPRNIISGDTYLFALLSQYGNAYYHSDITPNVYRKHSNGVFSKLGNTDRLINQNKTFFQIYISLDDKWKECVKDRLIQSQRGISSINTLNKNINSIIYELLNDQKWFSKISFYLYIRFIFKLFTKKLRLS